MDEELGCYRLIRRVGETDLSDVYAAIQRGDGGFVREVLVKRLKPHLSESFDALSAFQNEGRLLARLRHRGIPHVYDLRHDQQTGAWFSAIEYTSGPTLMHVLNVERERSAPIPMGLCITIATQLCAALHHVHDLRDTNGVALGVVHRNLAPQHIVLGRDGVARVTDFGAACTSEQLLALGPDGRGTAGYMAPEQVLAPDPPDRRADVFVLGILTYEMTTGQRLYEGTGERLRRALMDRDAPHPGQHRAGYPDALAEILLAALARNPYERPKSARQLQQQLEGFAAREGYQLGSRRLAEYLAEAFPPSEEDSFDASGAFTMPAHSSAPPPIIDDYDSDDAELSVHTWSAVPDVEGPATGPTTMTQSAPAPPLSPPPAPNVPGFETPPTAAQAPPTDETPLTDVEPSVRDTPISLPPTGASYVPPAPGSVRPGQPRRQAFARAPERPMPEGVSSPPPAWTPASPPDVDTAVDGSWRPGSPSSIPASKRTSPFTKRTSPVRPRLSEPPSAEISWKPSADPTLASGPPAEMSEDADYPDADDTLRTGGSRSRPPGGGTESEAPKLELHELDADDEDTFVGQSPTASERPAPDVTQSALPPERRKRPNGVYMHVAPRRSDTLKK